MRSTFYLFAVLFLATTFFSCETDEPSPRPTWGEIVNPIEAFMYPRDLKVFADGEEGRRWLILVVPDSTKSSFAPTSKSTPAEVARYKELSKLVGNPTEPVVNECHFHRTWLTQGVKAIPGCAHSCGWARRRCHCAMRQSLFLYGQTDFRLSIQMWQSKHLCQAARGDGRSGLPVASGERCVWLGGSAKSRPSQAAHCASPCRRNGNRKRTLG